MTANGLGSGGQVGLLTSLSPDDFSEATFDRRSLKDELRQAKFDPNLKLGDEDYKTPLSDKDWYEKFAPKLAARIGGLESDEQVADFLARLNGWVGENGKHYIDEKDGTNYLRPLLEAAHHVRQQLPEGLAERAGQSANFLQQEAAIVAPAGESIDERAPDTTRAEAVAAAGTAEQAAPVPTGLTAIEAALRDAPASAPIQMSAEDRALREAWRAVVEKAQAEERARQERRAKYGPTLRESLAEWADRSPWGQPFLYHPDTGATAFDSTIEVSKKAAAWSADATRQLAKGVAQWFKERFHRGEKDAAKTRPPLWERLRSVPSNIWSAIQERRKFAKEEKAKQKAERAPSIWKLIWKEKSLRPFFERVREARAAKDEAKPKQEAKPSLWREVWAAKSPKPAIDRLKKWLLTSKRARQEPPSHPADKSLVPDQKIAPSEISRQRRLARQARRIAFTMSDLASAMGDQPRTIELEKVGDMITAARYQPDMADGSLQVLQYQIAFTTVYVAVQRLPVAGMPGRFAMELQVHVGPSTEPAAEFWIVPGAEPRLVTQLKGDELDAVEQLMKFAEDASGWLFIWQMPIATSRPNASAAVVR